MKTISLPTNSRQLTLIKTLHCLSQCVGIEDWTLFVSCEPNKAIEQIIKDITFVSRCMRVNGTQVGCRENTYDAAEMAHLAGSTFNLYVEDDITLSRDALTLADQFNESQKDGVLCLMRFHKDQDLNAPAEVRPASQGLLGNGFGWRRDMFPVLQRHWLVNTRELPMWDWSVDAGLREEKIRQWRPMINRATSIGYQGTHCKGGHDLNLFGPKYEGEPVSQFQFIE